MTIEVDSKTASWIGAIVVVAAVCLYVGSTYAGQKEKTSDQDQLRVVEAQLASTTAELEKAKAQPKTAPKPTSTSSTNLDTVLLSYKIDSQDGEDVRNSLLTAAFNTPSQMCPAIISSRTTRDHIYFLVLDDIAKLKSQYGKYRSQLPYIDNSLDSMDGSIQIVKDKCEAVGVYI